MGTLQSPFLKPQGKSIWFPKHAPLFPGEPEDPNQADLTQCLSELFYVMFEYIIFLFKTKLSFVHMAER